MFYGTRRFITVFTKKKPFVAVLNQINPVHLPTYFVKIIKIRFFLHGSTGLVGLGLEV
jgi:hypothetical protein